LGGLLQAALIEQQQKAKLLSLRPRLLTTSRARDAYFQLVLCA
jgi:hypothetical protein